MFIVLNAIHGDGIELSSAGLFLLRIILNLDFIGEFLYHGAIDVEDLVAGSIQVHDDSAYDFNEDEVEGVLLLWNIIIIIITLLLIVFCISIPLLIVWGALPCGGY